MNPVMYLLVQRDHKMSRGKLAAQVAHAAVEAYRLSCKQGDLSESKVRNSAFFEETSIANRWRRGGHYAKIVLECDDIRVAERYISDRGFKTALIIDEGRTEFNDLTPTAIGVEIVDKDWGHAQATFSAFKLHGDDRRVPAEVYERLKAQLAEQKKPSLGQKLKRIWSPID